MDEQDIKDVVEVGRMGHGCKNWFNTDDFIRWVNHTKEKALTREQSNRLLRTIYETVSTGADGLNLAWKFEHPG